MFKPVPYKLGKLLRKNGGFQLRVIPTPHMFKEGPTPSVKHAVVFKGSVHDTWPTSLFKCEIKKLDRIMVFSNVRMNEELKVDEGSVHFFLGLFIEQAERWARAAGKSMVVMETRLPHVTEWFVEYGWKIVSSDSFGADKGYRGTKDFLEAEAA